MIFSRGFSQGIFFQGLHLHNYLFQGWGLIFFSGVIFFQGIELSKIQFHEVYESNNYSFQGILVSKTLVIHTSVWIKNGIAHCGVRKQCQR